VSVAAVDQLVVVKNLWRKLLAGGSLPRDSELLMARVLGVIYVCAAILTAVSLIFSGPSTEDEPVLAVVTLLWVVGGAGVLRFSDRVSRATTFSFAVLASVLVCLSIYFAGLASGIYSGIFVWLAVFAACFLPMRLSVGLMAWILSTYAITLAIVDNSGGFSSFTRWFTTVFVLAVLWASASWLVRGRAQVEETLRLEVGERKRLQGELRHAAGHDPLTDLPNRRRLAEDAKREFARSDRTGSPMTIAVLDLDRFKQFNDSRGHADGDELLCQVATLWRKALRATDVLARVGGDEFVALLPDCGVDRAEPVLDRLRQIVPFGQSCSIGFTEVEHGELLERALARADGSLYDGKERGRDRIARAPA
jgi:diguanylate cyclase (GGDEF)-like protein